MITLVGPKNGHTAGVQWAKIDLETNDEDAYEKAKTEFLNSFTPHGGLSEFYFSPLTKTNIAKNNRLSEILDKLWQYFNQEE